VTRAAIAALCSVVLVAGCGGNAGKQSGTASTASTANATSTAKAANATSTAKAADPTSTTKHRGPAKGTRVTVVRSQYGPVVADGRGQAFYLFASEKSGASRCYGTCAQRWPPVLANGTPRAGPGGHGRLLGTTRRTDGKIQLTYAGHPMYYYDGDAPGRILCQGVNEFGGLWLVVRPSGKPVI
jgi:predicted lipoprotein with Yx(FWY)xxD motif